MTSRYELILQSLVLRPKDGDTYEVRLFDNTKMFIAAVYQPSDNDYNQMSIQRYEIEQLYKALW